MSRIGKMNIAIIDADLIGRKRHRFPNLVCMKLSAYYKEAGHDVALVVTYEHLGQYDQVFIAKVFTDTVVPAAVLQQPNVVYGGTGFFYDTARPLPDAIEHHTPDYHLYDDWVRKQLAMGKPRTEFKYYLDYSIGYLTRGCFRHCVFCVNQHYDAVQVHSPLAEFVDPERKKICLLDDNFLGSPMWQSLLAALQETGRPFQFKQGLDERLLTPCNCQMLFHAKYDGDYIFAFDNYADAPVIEQKIKLARQYTQAVLKFYCFTGYDRGGQWNLAFWQRDILELLQRIEILMKHRCLPYVMRYNRYVESPYRGMYISIARWCNQPAFYKKKTLREFGVFNGVTSACNRYLRDFERLVPEVSYFYDLRFGGE